MAMALLAGFGALLWAALHWHWNIAGLVIAAGSGADHRARTAGIGPRVRPGKLSGDDLQGA